MQPRRILFSWIGHTDLRALAATLPATQQQDVLKGLNKEAPLPGERRPLKCLLDQERFDEVHLLSDYPSFKNRQYVEWLGSNAILHEVVLRNPIDYSELFQVVDTELASVVNVP